MVEYQRPLRLVTQAKVVRDNEDSGRSDAEVAVDNQLEELKKEAGWGVAGSAAGIGKAFPLEVAKWKDECEMID